MRHEISRRGPRPPAASKDFDRYPDEVTYFIQAENGGPVKIGRSRKFIVEQRLEALQCGNPHALVIRRVIEGDHETRLHHCYRDLRLRGEWFAVDPVLIEEARAVADEIPVDALALQQARQGGYREGWRKASDTIVQNSAAVITETLRDALKATAANTLARELLASEQSQGGA